MRAWELRAYDGPSGLEALQVPEPGRREGEVLVSVRAIGVNFPDLLMTKGLYQLKPDLPFVPGCEVAGQVLEAPVGSRFTAGDRVAAFTWTGGFAEVVSIPERSVGLIPPALTFEQGAAMVVNYHTTLFALERRARTEVGQRVLVLGAGGGIGTAAVQVARGLGAVVVAGVADESQRNTAERAGADAVLVLGRGFASEAMSMVEPRRGFDVVVDPVGAWLFDEALRALAPEGRLVTVGFAAGEIPTVAANRLLLRNVSVVGAAWGAFLDVDPGLMDDQAGRLAELVTAGAVRPVVDSVAEFDDLPDLLRRLDRGEIAGKAVIGLPSGG